MAAKIRSAGPVTQLQQLVHQYLYYRAEEKKARSQKEKAYTKAQADKGRSAIVNYILEHGEEDPETRSLRWYFKKPLFIDGVTYAGLEWRRSPIPYVKEERAQELAEKYGAAQDMMTWHYTLPGLSPKQVLELNEYFGKEGIVPESSITWDYDHLYVLNQQGKLTDDELDSVLGEDESFSLWPIEE